MISLSRIQQFALQEITLEIHRATSRDDLVAMTLLRIPKILGINYTVWHDRLKNSGLTADKVLAKPDHRNAIIDYLEEINNHLLTHPIITGLEIQDSMDIPRKVVTMRDFASQREIENTPIFTDAYRHLEIKNHAVVEFFDPTGEGVMICFNGHKEYTAEQKFMIQCIRDHFEIAYCKLNTLKHQDGMIRSIFDQNISSSLSKREREVFPLIISGKTNPEIAIILGISPRTVEKHVAAILEKSGIENRKALMSYILSKSKIG